MTGTVGIYGTWDGFERGLNQMSHEISKLTDALLDLYKDVDGSAKVRIQKLYSMAQCINSDTCNLINTCDYNAGKFLGSVESGEFHYIDKDLVELALKELDE